MNGNIYFTYYKVIYHTQLLTCMSVMKHNCNCDGYLILQQDTVTP